MNNKTIWNIHPDQMKLLVDELIMLINGQSKKFLLNTFFVEDVDQFLGHKNAKEVIISMVHHFYMRTKGKPPSTEIQKYIRRSLRDEIRLYVPANEVARLGIMTPNRLMLYQDLGLINMEKFTHQKKIGYSWKTLKEITS